MNNSNRGRHICGTGVFYNFQVFRQHKRFNGMLFMVNFISAPKIEAVADATSAIATTDTVVGVVLSLEKDLQT